MTKREFIEYLVIEYLADTCSSQVYKLCCNFKTFFIQVLDKHVCIMMTDSNINENSHACIIETLQPNGTICYEKILKHLEQLIYV